MHSQMVMICDRLPFQGMTYWISFDTQKRPRLAWGSSAGQEIRLKAKYSLLLTKTRFLGRCGFRSRHDDLVAYK